jgi:hypothetical protein
MYYVPNILGLFRRAAEQADGYLYGTVRIPAYFPPS